MLSRRQPTTAPEPTIIVIHFLEIKCKTFNFKTSFYCQGNCGSTALITKDLIAGDRWFSLRFTTTAHPDCNMTHVLVTLTGPLNKPDLFNPPPNTEKNIKMSCFGDPDPDGYWTFASSETSSSCSQFPLWPCSNFTMAMTPKYAACPTNSSVATSLIFNTSPGSRQNDVPINYLFLS